MVWQIEQLLVAKCDDQAPTKSTGGVMHLAKRGTVVSELRSHYNHCNEYKNPKYGGEG